MILLDTDHLTVLKYPESANCAHLTAHMAASVDQRFGTTIVNAEEQLRGWLAKINEVPKVHRQVIAYSGLLKLLVFLGGFLFNHSTRRPLMSLTACEVRESESRQWT